MDSTLLRIVNLNSTDLFSTAVLKYYSSTVILQKSYANPGALSCPGLYLPYCTHYTQLYSFSLRPTPGPVCAAQTKSNQPKLQSKVLCTTVSSILTLLLGQTNNDDEDDDFWLSVFWRMIMMPTVMRMMMICFPTECRYGNHLHRATTALHPLNLNPSAPQPIIISFSTRCKSYCPS